VRKLLCFFTILHFVVSGQNLDSLTRVWNDNSKPDSLRLAALSSVARKFVFSNPDTAYGLAQKIIGKAIESKQKKFESLGNNVTALTYYVKGDYETALKYYYKCISICEEMSASKTVYISNQGKAAYAKILNNIGNIYLDKGNYPKAISYYLSSLKTVESLNDKEGLASALSNVGMIYGMQGNYEKSLEYLHRGLKVVTELGDLQGKANDLNNIGNIYLEKKDYDKAAEYQMESLKLRLQIEDKQGISSSYCNLGNICTFQAGALKEKGKDGPEAKALLEKALDYQFKGLKYLEEVGDKKGISTVQSAIGNLKNKLGLYKEALDWCTRSYAVSAGTGALAEEKEACYCLYEANKGTGNKSESLKYFEKFVALRDTLKNEERSREITKNQFEFEYGVKAAADSVKVAEEKKMIGIKLEHERTQKYALYGGLFLVAIFAAFMFNRFKVTQKQNKIIEQQKNVVEEKQKEILDSIQYAKHLQKAVLANEDILNEFLPNHILFAKPKDIVSGDFCWAMHKNERFYVALCDSTGHGVPGAFMSLLNISFLNEAINERNIEEPNEILNYVRQRLIQNMNQDGQQDGMDGILLCVHKNKVTYAAGQNAPVIMNEGQWTELPTDIMPIGKGEKTESFKKYEIEVKKGDVVFLYTDGFADQFGGPKGKKFKYKPLNDLLLSISSKPVDEAKEILNSTFEEWRGTQEQIDDVCILGIRF
jgi:serine phosphatase RsbU (regulator of sigma subunit)